MADPIIQSLKVLGGYGKKRPVPVTRVRPPIAGLSKGSMVDGAFLGVDSGKPATASQWARHVALTISKCGTLATRPMKHNHFHVAAEVAHESAGQKYKTENLLMTGQYTPAEPCGLSAHDTPSTPTHQELTRHMWARLWAELASGSMSLFFILGRLVCTPHPSCQLASRTISYQWTCSPVPLHTPLSGKTAYRQLDIHIYIHICVCRPT